MSEFEDWVKRNNAARPASQHSVGIAPLAKRIAEENHLEWQGLTGTGADGLIVEKDVLSAIAKRK